MKIAITGASGFVGSFLVKELNTRKYFINGLSRKKREPLYDEFKWYQGDINNKKLLRDFLKDCEVVCNCAGEISNTNNFQQTNIEGVKTLYKASIDSKVNLFIQLSSGGIYSDLSKGEITEQTQICGKNDYEKSKIEIEEWLKKQTGIKTVLLRPTTVYGAEMPNDSLKGLFRAILNKKFFHIGSKKSYSCYISIDNLVSAIILLIEERSKLINKIGHYHAYNLSHDIFYQDFIAFAAKALNSKQSFYRFPLWLILFLLNVNKFSFNLELPLTENRAKTLSRRSTFSSQKFQQDFSWSPLKTHNESIKECVDKWF